jgi:hypothetical protein
MGLTLCSCCSADRLFTHLAVVPRNVIAMRATQQSLAGATPGSSGSGAGVATGLSGQELLTTTTTSTVGQEAQSGLSAAMVDVSAAEWAGEGRTT